MSAPTYADSLRALRDQAALAEDGGEATRLRIARTYALRAASRRRVVASALALAAALLTGTALAYFIARGGSSPAHLPAADGQDDATWRRRLSKVEILPRTSALPDAAMTQPNLGRIPLRSGARRVADAGSTGAEPATPPSPPQATHRAAQAIDALYVTAHRLHFRGAPSAALAAWDAYLATGPRGPRALEASYQRALTLSRLGRRDEAVAALLPFARGMRGGFRQREAALLIERLAEGSTTGRRVPPNGRR